MYAVWERLVRVDYEEADIVKPWRNTVKKRAGERGDRLLPQGPAPIHQQRLFTNVKEIWNKLIEQPRGHRLLPPCPAEDRQADQRGQGRRPAHRSVQHYKAKEDWDTATDILKVVISYDDKNPAIRKEIADCYRGKYAEHSHVDEYIRMSNLAQSYRSVSEAMADFEKHIAFDVGNFVFHRTWNIGRIASIQGDEIVIDFAKKRGHAMGLKMAIDSLVTLSRDHIWVLKAVWSKEKLHDKIKSDPVWALRTVIRSFDNRADLKKIKAELVPSVLSQGEWTSWSSKVREILKTDPMFGNAQDSIGTFVVRDRSLSFADKIYTQFKAEKGFFERVRFLRDLANKDLTDSEYFMEMLGFFTGYLRSYSTVNEYIMASYLLIKELAAEHKHLASNLTLQFSELFENLEDVVSVYEGLKDAELKTAFLQNIKMFVPDWADVYVRLFPYSLSPSMINTLLSAGHTENLQRMVLDIIENYKDHRDAFIWVVKNLWDEPWVKNLKLSYEKMLITLIHILDISFKEIENHRDTTDNRKINKQVQQILFKDGTSGQFLERIRA